MYREKRGNEEVKREPIRELSLRAYIEVQG